MDMLAHPELLHILEMRFAAHPERHRDLEWSAVQAKLVAHPDKLDALAFMEQSGGEPDVIGVDPENHAIIFCDCAPESPSGRRSLCYDRAALDARKANKPSGSAVEIATAHGLELLSEAEYRALQTLGAFDGKTSSWLKTPEAIRARGGAIFGDRRYDHVFIYHNGAESYYAARGFRALLRVG